MLQPTTKRRPPPNRNEQATEGACYVLAYQLHSACADAQPVVPADDLRPPLNANVSRHMPSQRRQFIALLVILLAVETVRAVGANVEYRVNAKAHWGGTAHEGEIEASPRKLKQLFGTPLLSDGASESLGTYVFTSSNGTVLTLYYRAHDVPRKRIEALRASFWEQESEVEFHIGAKGNQHVPAFKAWLVQRLATNGG